MNIQSIAPHQDPIAKGVFFAVMACWAIFLAASIFRKRPPKSGETRREGVALVGIVLQGAAYAIVWSMRRASFTPIVPMPLPVEIALAAITVGLAIFSGGLVVLAIRTLGKQWALSARLVEGHKLITAGPYRWVRNPIYTGMFGMMLATGFAVSHWLSFPPALVLFGFGTVIRVRSEEKLLRGAFGKEFDEYARRVPAVLPGIY